MDVRTGTTTRQLGVIAVAAVALVGATGCSGEDVAERAFERAIERQIATEGGGNVDLDLGDDGNFSIRTEDGEFSINADADGNISIGGAGPDGTFSIDADAAGNVSSEGLGGGDGDVSIQSDGGQTVIESEDGSSVMTMGGDLPDGFPSSVPLPADLTVVVGQSVNTEWGIGYVVSGTAPGDHQAYADQLDAALTAAGYTQQSSTTTPQGAMVAYSGAEHTVVAILGADASSGGMSVTLQVGPPDG